MYILDYCGGEPFLSQNLISTINKILQTGKVQRIEIVTNGTIIPSSPKLIDILKNKKIIICISQYPNVDKNKLVLFLEKNNINYRIDKMNFWMNYGNVKKRNKNINELKKQFRKCNHVCNSLLNGQLHLCPRSSHSTDLGIIKNNENDYVDLLNPNTTIEQKKELISALLKKKYILACDYCDFASPQCKKIPVAEQIKIKNS